MFYKSRVMLYAEDVLKISQFFIEQLGAETVETIELPQGDHSIVLRLSKEFELAIFPKAFVQRFSPEVLGPPPSIIFFTKEFEALYEKIETAGEMIENNGLLTFNFSDPEGNYFVIGKAGNL
ncbi:hypothetical protein A5844_001347 [Enterococcus sp. 10A9_DIV0425]|uniref:VOC domain-containing protein n=1 Tax=Candidatus Enterococcus wittei TaxID=1987383 RepID=A0A242K0X3_9ENTE|nr:glyoxalase [Enterococcus sp. 10A9_DIV0425]OTP11213.1 hypothetical protein A5844_001347 [Enterococcus sp. 10A9_DIV0425]THE15766.1 glyoxalase [Enterococcus hirae]